MKNGWRSILKAFHKNKGVIEIPTLKNLLLKWNKKKVYERKWNQLLKKIEFKK